MKTKKTLEQVNKEILKCKVCPIGKIGLPVVGEGDAKAKLAFIGEAPGKQEAETGRPFVGRSGKYLRVLINSIGINPEDVYITSVVKYLPIYVTPTNKDIEHGRTHLLEQLNAIKPRMVVMLGKTAAKGLLERDVKFAEELGTVFEKDGFKYFLTYHPAAILYNPKLKPKMEETFQKTLRPLLK